MVAESFAAVIYMMAGRADHETRPKIEADALDIQHGADRWAYAVKGVADHEEWLRRAFAGGPMSERGVAWFGLLVVSGTIALPILIRHGLIPAQIGPMAETILRTRDQPAGSPAEPEPAAA
jgi:hypothetical protein